ncbi:hypothetical protein Y032_0116g566 [Ancylostoma ceylanicum]|uniref:Uncharacterized protein n=1 Tax=Ancylostoma ceylanicum TaxID=53326 RepID=A0A016TBH2_9BILA|nr:hypothetical protein Y032_0116g566 [Ancylostoma ceylanicum]
MSKARTSAPPWGVRAYHHETLWMLIVGYTERRQQSFHLSLSRARVVQGVLSVRETRRASCSSLKDFVNKSDHPFGGLPVARFTFRGVQSLTVLVQRCSFRRISCAAHLILLNLA